MKDRVLFFSKYDISLAWQYDRIAELMQDKDRWSEFDDIEDIIELYQLMLVIETELRPVNLSDSDWEEYKYAAKGVKKIVAKRFARVNDATIESELDKVDFSYIEPFWDILIAFGGTERVDSITVEHLLNLDKAHILHLLTNKQAVSAYGEVIRRFLQNNLCYASVLVTKYLEKKEENYTSYHFPEELTKEDKIEIIERYIDYPDASVGDLKLLSISKGTDQLPISPRLRLKAKNKYIEKMERLSKTSVTVSHGISVTFKQQEKTVLVNKKGNEFFFSYDVDWINSNLDYPTLLNNFIFLFEFADIHYRWKHISYKSMMSSLERSMGTKGNREYIIGGGFCIIQMIAHAQLQAYILQLEKNNVFIEEMIKWFFESYLPCEFNAKGFVYNVSSKNSSVLDRCRNIAIEIDSILKQYRLFCEDGIVNRELFEMGTEHMYVSNIPSRVKDKYGYPIDDTIARILYLLFSDQSMMLYHKGSERYKNAFEVLMDRTFNYNELLPYQKRDVDYLIDMGILWLDENDNIAFSCKLLLALLDLYNNEFICMKYMEGFAEEIDFLKKNNLISINSSLMAIPEQNYFNYIFNNSEYDNSKDLRNKYAHGNQTMNEDIMRDDYITMLRMMILIILKINEEFCLTDKNT